MKQHHKDNTVGPWAKNKLDRLEKYLKAYCTALKEQPFKLIYINAFAGSCKSKIRSSKSINDDQIVAISTR